MIIQRGTECLLISHSFPFILALLQFITYNYSIGLEIMYLFL